MNKPNKVRLAHETGRKKSGHRPEGIKILVGLMLQEDRNVKRVFGAISMILLLVLGLWYLPGTTLLWRVLTLLQITARYKTGFLDNDNNNYDRATQIYGVSDKSLGRVFNNLKRVWDTAVYSSSSSSSSSSSKDS